MPDTPVAKPNASDAASLLPAIRAIVGDRGLLTEASNTAPYARDWRKLYTGRTAAVVRPADTTEVAAMVKLAAEAGVARA